MMELHSGYRLLSIYIRNYIDCSLAQPAALFWLSSVATSHRLVVVPQSGAKDQFYRTVYYITLYSNCKARGVSKNFKKIVEDRVRSQNYCMGDLNLI